MEVMEDGNLMDKVNILIQRDMEYYKAKQAVLQETVCPGIIGGRLDFPRSASFAAKKLVVWWEEEYVAAYRKPSGFFQKNIEGTRDSIETSGGCGGIVRSSDPAKFISALSKSADQLLEHLHVLTQEALDHADLTVLTGTIGAAALLKNCLWFYIQTLNEVKTATSIGPLQSGYKKYHEMCEALAERLLDLHCRLLSLYILQDADCLDWENVKPFSESERGSYIIQMWWLYMQGTRVDLWNTVPPKMAQRVFSGMLNESLTILTVRYTQSLPSEARSDLLLVDLSNLLLCMAQLLPSICNSADEFINLAQHHKNGKLLRDIHVKCQELYSCFLLRGSTLDALHRVFKKGLENVNLFKPKLPGPAPWIVFSLPNIFKTPDMAANKLLNERSSLGLELMVLLAQPQPDWALFLKVLCSKNFKILQLLFNEFLDKSKHVDLKRTVPKSVDCANLLCAADGSCKNIDSTSATFNSLHYYDLVMSAAEVFLYVGNDEELRQFFVEAVMRSPDWSKCFERRNVWNQIRSPWYEAIINQVCPILPLVVDTVINALSTGATMYQAMALIIACLSQYWDAIDSSLPRIAQLFQEVIPSDVAPVSNSVLMQILVSALYTNLIMLLENVSVKKEVTFQNAAEEKNGKLNNSSAGTTKEPDGPISNAAAAAAESLCSIDEDNKHTDQIEEFLNQANNTRDDFSSFGNAGSKRVEQNQQMVEILVSDLLMSTQGKKSLKVLFHFVKHNSEWLYQKLEISEKAEPSVPNKVFCPPEPLLHKMFHIGYRPFDQLLTRQLKPNWQMLLQTPLGLTLEKVWMQIACRWEFRNPTSSSLSAHNMDIVNHLCLILKQ